jgi:esterase/lipase
MVSPLARYLPSREEGSIRDPRERERNRGFGTVTPRLLNELRQIVRRAQQVLPDVRQPTLVIQSRDDNRIEEAAATRSFDRLGSGEKRFVWTEGSGHVITVDTGRERVLALTGEWLLERADAIAPRSPPPPTAR